MGFPDQIERTVEIADPQGKVWAALATAEGLAAWFGDDAEGWAKELAGYLGAA